MSLFRMSRREKALASMAPITEKPGTDRRMRVAVLRELAPRAPWHANRGGTKTRRSHA